MVKQNVNYGLYILTLAATLIIFLTGLLVGNMLNTTKMDGISQDISYLEEMRNIQETNLLLLDSLGEKKCSALGYYLDLMVPELEELGQMVDRYESSSDSKRYQADEYKSLKSNYMLLQIKYWTLTKSFEKDCAQPIDDILYFYSNENCTDCRSQGIVLDSIKKNHPEVMIFSFEGDSNVSSIRIMAKTFNATVFPTLVVNGKIHQGYMDKFGIEGQIGKR